MAYTKDFLIDVFLSRFMESKNITPEQIERLEQIANEHYDEVGRDTFRVNAQVTPEAIRKYNASL